MQYISSIAVGRDDRYALKAAMVTGFPVAIYLQSMISVISRHKQRRKNNVANDKIADAVHFLSTRNFQRAFALMVAS